MTAEQLITTKPTTPEEFAALVASIQDSEGYIKPQAFGIGIATYIGNQLLDVDFLVLNVGENLGSAAILSHFGEWYDDGSLVLTLKKLKKKVLPCFAPFINDGKEHLNIDAIEEAIAFLEKSKGDAGHERVFVPVVAWINDLQAAPTSPLDAWLRLALVSNLKFEPNAINMSVFGVLPLIAWTSEGPLLPEQVPTARRDLRRWGGWLRVHGVDKFPAMTDYVIPEGVRIADATRVRLGAHLARETVVMHEGFVNFNAGTLGKSMVEGRISAGVVVGAGSDIGGGASLMGTLSGGGTERVSVGTGSLVGANAGIGIALGSNCIVEAGAYITAGAKVTLVNQSGEAGGTVQAVALSGADNLLFRRNSITGALEAIDRKPDSEAVVLNEVLHATTPASA